MTLPETTHASDDAFASGAGTTVGVDVDGTASGLLK